MGKVPRILFLISIVFGCVLLGGCAKTFMWFSNLNDEAKEEPDEPVPDPKPQILFIYPTHYSTSGGQAINIRGFDFQPNTVILIDGVPCTNMVFTTSILISADVPPHAVGTADVTVVNPDGQSDTAPGAIIYTTGPVIRSLVPDRGSEAGGTAVSVNGFNFQPGLTLTIGGNPPAVFNVISTNLITCTTPPGILGAQPVTVTNPDTQTYTFNYYLYTYAPPVITSIVPPNGTNMGGNTVTIGGFYFRPGATVIFGTNSCPAVNVIDANTITVTVPIGPHPVGSVDVIVINTDNQRDTVTNGYTYMFTSPAPTVTNVNPTSGPIAGGTIVTITGTGFQGGATVSFGSFPAMSQAVVSATQIIATTAPATGLAGTTPVNVTVTNPDTQSGTLPNGFSYVAPAGNHIASYVIDTSPGCDLWFFDFQANIVQFRAVMIQAGIHTNGTDPLTDTYVEDWLQGDILGYTSTFYRRNFDGTKITGASFNICFIGTQPGGTWVGPPSHSGPAQPFQYNVMHYPGPDPNAGGALGRAALDFSTNAGGMPVNGRRENNCLANGLGIFCQPIWTNLQNWGRVSVLSPVLSAADRKFVDGSYVLGSGTVADDTRFVAIRDNVKNFADGLATVCMHEAGHSVGLVITARNAGNHCPINTCPLKPVATWGQSSFCTGASSCTAELAVSLGYSP